MWCWHTSILTDGLSVQRLLATDGQLVYRGCGIVTKIFLTLCSNSTMLNVSAAQQLTCILVSTSAAQTFQDYWVALRLRYREISSVSVSVYSVLGHMPPEPERKGEHSYKGCRFLGSSITRETRGSSQGGSGDLVLSQGC